MGHCNPTEVRATAIYHSTAYTVIVSHFYTYNLHETAKRTLHSYIPSGSEGNGSVKTSGLTSSILKEGKEGAPDSHAKQRPQSK